MYVTIFSFGFCCLLCPNLLACLWFTVITDSTPSTQYALIFLVRLWIIHLDVVDGRWDLGLQSTRLHHRLSETRTIGENLYSEPIDISAAGTAFTLPPKHSGLIVQDNSGLPGIKIGTAYVEDDDRLVILETRK